MPILLHFVNNYQMSPQKQFRILQSQLDELGVITNINRIVVGKRYEVQVNGVIEKVYKQRQSAKLFITNILKKN